VEERTAEEKKHGHRRNPLRAWSRSGSKKEKQAIADGTIPPKHRRDGGPKPEGHARAEHDVQKAMRKKHGLPSKPIGGTK
jgi:hypothetical protein